MYTFGKTKTKNLCCVFQVNGDPDIGLNGQKLKNFKVEKNSYFFTSTSFTTTLFPADSCSNV
jgi:hypothetical protein